MEQYTSVGVERGMELTEHICQSEYMLMTRNDCAGH